MAPCAYLANPSWPCVVFGAASLSSRASRLWRGLDEFREGDQRAIAEPVGGKPLAGALLPVDEGIETHDSRTEPLHQLTAGQQGGPGGGQNLRAARPPCLVAGGCR